MFWKTKSPSQVVLEGHTRSRREKRAATARPERIWDYAVIPYEIDSNFSGVHKVSKYLINQSMDGLLDYSIFSNADYPPLRSPHSLYGRERGLIVERFLKSPLS